MLDDAAETNLTMLSLVKDSGDLEISLTHQTPPEPEENEVLVRVAAAPINPSDLFLLLAGAEVSALKDSVHGGAPFVAGTVPAPLMPSLAGRIGQQMPVGNEGSGVVVKAGSSPKAQALLGKNVAVLGGGMYAKYRCIHASACMELPEGVDLRKGASSFVNPLTSLGFVETAKKEGHKAIVHTAAASNLGQMLNRICIADGVPLVNIVRKDAQVDLLRKQGAKYVLNSTDPDFNEALCSAVAETGATVVFDPIGGGKLGGKILEAMENVARNEMTEYNRYGSDLFKQLYIYGALDVGGTEFSRNAFGFRWSISGWLLTHFLERAGQDALGQMRTRVGAEITTTFASDYSHEISLENAVNQETIAAYSAMRTGDKYLICP